MMKWTKCAIRFLRISRPGVRVPSIAPENAVKSKDFMAFLFCKPWLHGFCTVSVFHVRWCRALYCIAISALFFIRWAELSGALPSFPGRHPWAVQAEPSWRWWVRLRRVQPAGWRCRAWHRSRFQTSCPAPHGRTAGYKRRTKWFYRFIQMKNIVIVL